MPGIGVILNPNSKHFVKDPSKAKQMGFIVGDKASCKATEDIHDLRRVAEEFKSRDIDILAISGGDGTIHCTLTMFINIYGEKPLPKICFLRGGTVNTITSCLKIKGSSEDILSNLLVKYHEDIEFDTAYLQTTKINNEYGFLFGIGAIYRFMEAYYQGTPSPSQAAVVLLKSVLSGAVNSKFIRKMFEPFNAQVIADGKEWPFKNYNALLTGSIISLGLGSKVFYHMQNNPDSIHAYGFNMLPKQIIGSPTNSTLLKLIRGKEPKSPHLISQPVQSMTIKLDKPIYYMIDGDMKHTSDYFKISTGPMLEVVLP